jgi:hypothetical protein
VNSITALNVAFTENFDSMGPATSSASSQMPPGFAWSTSGAWIEDNQGTNRAGGTTGADAMNGSSAGGRYNFGNGVTASATDRALGFLTSGSYPDPPSPLSYIVRITNNTGSAIGSLAISFDYEKYRSGTRAFNWTFFHGATVTPGISATAGDQSYAADTNTTTVPNPPTSISKSFTLTGLTADVRERERAQ